MTLQTNGWQNYVDIQPFKASFLDTEDSTRLFITKIEDNAYNSALIHWELRSTPTEEVRDEEGNITTAATVGITSKRDHYTMTGDEYIGWGTDSLYPFTLLINAYKLTTL